MRESNFPPAPLFWIILQAGALVLLVAGSILVFWPGLSGAFLFDDVPNLQKLSRFGEVRDLDTFLAALSNGIAGPLGRPVSLLTFLMNDTAWPTLPEAFKYTNILLHALNALLLFWLIWLLCRATGNHERKALTVAFLASACWALHPLWASTTLYVVQRMAMLATTFSLAAFILYVKGRVLVVEGRTWSGMLRIGFGLGFFGVLALLSKENAVLLPLQMLVLEVFLFRAPQYRDRFGVPPRIYQLFVVLALVLPGLLILAWLLRYWPGAMHRYLIEYGYTLWERALTENRIIFEYLHLLFIPVDSTRGLFYDDLVHSSGFLSPWTTMPALFGIIGLLLGGWLLRARYAVGGLVIYFFLVGHLLETWATPLELAFEHRNYLPALLLFWPLAQLLASERVAAWMSGWGTVLVGGALLVFLSVNTVSRSALWGSPFHLAIAWAEENPLSERAQGYAAEAYVMFGMPQKAEQHMERALQKLPHSKPLVLGGMQVVCMTGERRDWVERTEQALEHGEVRGYFSLEALENILNLIERGYCDALQPQDVRRVAEALLRNPASYVWLGSNQAFTYLVGRASLMAGEPDAALAAFRRMVDVIPELDGVMQAAALMGASGYPREGLELLDYWQKVGKKRINMKGTGKSALLRKRHRKMMLNELQNMRMVLEADVRSLEEVNRHD